MESCYKESKLFIFSHQQVARNTLLVVLACPSHLNSLNHRLQKKNNFSLHLSLTFLIWFQNQLSQRGFKLRGKLANHSAGQPLPTTLKVLPTTAQIRGLHTFIRNCNTRRDEFIFYSKRLIRLVNYNLFFYFTCFAKCQKK
jgi:hypothetical protein